MLGQKLRELAEEKGLSIKKIAKDCDIPYTTLSNYLNRGTEPSLKQLCAFADYFDVTVDYLVGRTDDFGVVSGQNGTSLSADEHALVEAYRKLPEKRRDAILDTVITLAKVN